MAADAKVLELAQAFIELFEDCGANGISDEMTWQEIQVSNKYWDRFEACQKIVKEAKANGG